MANTLSTSDERGLEAVQVRPVAVLPELDDAAGVKVGGAIHRKKCGIAIHLEQFGFLIGGLSRADLRLRHSDGQAAGAEHLLKPVFDQIVGCDVEELGGKSVLQDGRTHPR